MNKKNINFPWKADLNKKSGKVQIKKIIETFNFMVVMKLKNTNFTNIKALF